MVGTESKDEIDSLAGVAPLTGETTNENKDIESGEAATTTPEPSWPLSALFAKKNWHRFRRLTIGSAVVMDGPTRRRQRSRSPFGSFRAQRDPEVGGDGKKLEKSTIRSHPPLVLPDNKDEEAGAKSRSRSPLQRFNLCRTTFYTSDKADWLSADEEINDRREFIVVLAASLQKFGAATHLTSQRCVNAHTNVLRSG